jgi:hypothetical protein
MTDRTIWFTMGRINPLKAEEVRTYIVQLKGAYPVSLASQSTTMAALKTKAIRSRNWHDKKERKKQASQLRNIPTSLPVRKKKLISIQVCLCALWTMNLLGFRGID